MIKRVYMGKLLLKLNVFVVRGVFDFQSNCNAAVKLMLNRLTRLSLVAFLQFGC